MKNKNHAVVIGASMAGLVTARALADFYSEVTVLERDIFPAIGLNRKGVPQGHHTHALLPTGLQVLEKFFPGLTQELSKQGAVVVDPMLYSRRYLNGYYHCQFDSGLKALYLSRPLLESNVRKRLFEIPNVRALQNCDVLGLLTTEDKTQISGVRIIRRNDGSAEELMHADLIVDASGRGSRSPQWLTAMGYDKAEEERVQIGMGYVSRIYRRKPDLHDTVLVNVAAPPETRLGVIAAQEGDRWIVSIAGYLGDHAPTDPDAFLEFSKTLPAPDIYNIIKDAEPLSAPIAATFPANIRRHYEKLSRFPENFLVIGDALCSFNPVYGQGMTVAASQASALHSLLTRGEKNLTKAFFKRASALVDNPWAIAVGGDLRINGVEGKRNFVKTLLAHYLNRLHRGAQIEPELVMAFAKVVSLKTSTASLIHPAILWKVLATNWKLDRQKKKKFFDRGKVNSNFKEVS